LTTYTPIGIIEPQYSLPQKGGITLEKLAEVLEWGGIKRDIYVNVAGGMRVDDPAVDLAIAAAIVSSYRERALEESVMVFGEVGLTGEVRQAGQSSRRLKEGAKFGFTCCVLPQGTYLEGGSKMHILESPNVAHALLSLGLE
jgi:predicted ATP-dependent serine protease